MTSRTVKAETGHKHGNESFPIHYEGQSLRAYTNPSGELFVEDTRSGATIRINSYHLGGLQFTTDGRVEPIRITNMIGWSVTPR